MISPWTRVVRWTAWGAASISLLVGAVPGDLKAQLSSTRAQRPAAQPFQPSPSPSRAPAPPAPAQTSTQLLQPAESLLQALQPAQPPATPSAPPAQAPPAPQPPQPSPPAPAVPPPPAPTPPPSLAPPSPFVPQPGVPPTTLPPQKVAEVAVRGNDKVPTDQILAVVSTKVNDPLNEEKLRNDIQAILNLGLFADAVVRFEPVEGGVRVVFVVVENPVIQSIVIKQNTVISTDDILKALGVQAGQVLNTAAMRSGVRAVEKLYQDKGYILAHVADVNVSPEGVLTLTVSEGRIEAVKIEGLHKTHDYVVRRELLFKPGDIFNINAVNASLKRLFQLQYFSDVKAQPGPGTAPDTVDVTIQVTEQKTTTVSFGAGYGSTTGLEGFVGVRDSNFGGNGQNVSLQYTQTVYYGLSFIFSFHEPYFRGSHTTMDLQLFDTTTIPTNYTLGFSSPFQYNLTQVGGFVSFTTPLDPIHSINYGVKSANSTFANPTVGTPPPANFPFTPGVVNAVILGIGQDTRNDPLNPTSGEHILFSAELAFTAIGGTFNFQKLELDYARFIPVGAESTVVGHAHLGYSPVAMPIQEQFYLGGQTTLRGYAFDRFQGDEEILLQGEYRFPISGLPFLKRITGVTGVVFIDAGNTWTAASGINFNLNADAGVGLQVKTPLGPFRLDYGVSHEGGYVWISTGVLF
jgi:outer membrane protein insertion porin family